MLSVFILAFIVGVISGLVTFIFGTGINLIVKFVAFAFPYNLLLLPLVGFFTIKVRDVYKKEVNGSMAQIFQGTKTGDKLSMLIVPYQMICTWFSHLAGASVGREGVAVQLGATVANNASKYVPSVSRKKFTRLGMAAGFAGLFGTPLAATVFSFEVTRNRRLDLPYIGATLLATYTSAFISSALGLSHFHIKSEFIMLDLRQLIFFAFSVVMFVVVGHSFASVLKRAKKHYSMLKIKDSYKIVILSIIGAILLFVINDGRYMSLGTNIITDAFNNPLAVNNLDFILKFMFTIYFVAIGFQGGEVTPLFAIGSSLGVVLASIFSLPLTLVAGIGYAFVFGNATNGYFTGAVLAVEVFGIGIAPYAVIALLITLCICDDKHSIYPRVDWE